MKLEKKNAVKEIFSVLLICLVFIPIFATAKPAPTDDRYIEGYATAVLEREFNLRCSSLEVKDGVITIGIRNIPDKIDEKIITTLSDIPGVIKVKFIYAGVDTADLKASGATECKLPEYQFLPKGRLFGPLLADPRWAHFSASYLNCMDDKEFNNMGAVSFGETFSLLRCNSLTKGQWEMGIEAAVFSLFDLDADSYDLINSDFRVAFPYISYCYGKLSTLWRLFHQSSHLGDEYLLRDNVNSINLSYEGMDMLLSYDFSKAVRVYGGGGYLIHRNPSDLEKWSTQVGIELEFPKHFLNTAARPIAAVDLQHRQESDWNWDLSLKIGIQFETPQSLTKKYQLLLEYYKGYSPHGQFYSRRIEYITIGNHVYF